MQALYVVKRRQQIKITALSGCYHVSQRKRYTDSFSILNGKDARRIAEVTTTNRTIHIYDSSD